MLNEFLKLKGVKRLSQSRKKSIIGGDGHFASIVENGSTHFYWVEDGNWTYIRTVVSIFA